MKNKTKIITECFLTVILLTSVVCASFAMGPPYSKDNPLMMNYGETKVVYFNLQNMIGDSDSSVKVSIIKGSELVSLDKELYNVKIGTHDTMVPFTITIPEDYSKNIQEIELKFQEVSNENEGGMISFGVSYNAPFNVILSEKPIPPSSYIGTIIVLIIVILLLVLVILVILLRKKKRK